MKNLALLMPLTLSAALGLSGCGGGGGTSGSPLPNPSPPSTFSPITAANATKVASNAHAANASFSDSSSTVITALTGVSISGVNINTLSPALDLVNRAYNRGAPKLLTGITVSSACTGGGTVSIDGTVRSEVVASNGDRITITAVNCVEDGVTLNGAFTISLSGISGIAFASNVWSATLDVQFNSFTARSGSDVAGASGDMKLVISQTSFNSNSVAISGNSLQTSLSMGGNASSLTLTEYAASGATQGNTFTGAANYTMSGNTSVLGQFKYSVKNLKPFVSVGGALPGSGSFIVNGATSSVTLTVVEGARVRLDYSAKGDGVITQTSTVDWAAFIPSL
jgi:hypothetical protein